MGLYDCPKCWSSHCDCGYESSTLTLIESLKKISGILSMRHKCLHDAEVETHQIRGPICSLCCESIKDTAPTTPPSHTSKHTSSSPRRQ